MIGIRRQWLRRSLITTGVFLSVVLIALAGTAALSLTQFGRDRIAGLAEGTLSDATQQVRIEGLSGNLFGSWSVAKIIISDLEGPYLHVEEAQISWRPLSLVTRTVDVSTIRIGRLNLVRAPKTSSDSGAGLPVKLNLSKVAIADLQMGTAVLGKSLSAKIDGSLHVEPGFPDGRFSTNLNMTYGSRGRASLQVDYSLDPSRIAIKAKIEEPDGDFIGRIAALPEGTPLSFQVNGSGPPEAWVGSSSFTAGEMISANAQLAISVVNKRLSLKTHGELETGVTVPRWAGSFTADHFSFDLETILDQDGILTVPSFKISNPTLIADGNGRYLFQSGKIESSAIIKMDLPDRAPASVFVKNGILNAVVSGTLDTPTLSLRGSADRLSFDEIELRAQDINFHVTKSRTGQLQITGDVSVDGLQLQKSVPATLYGSSLTLSVEGVAEPDQSIPRFSLAVRSGPTDVRLDGNRKADGAIAGSYRGSLSNLANLSPLPEVPLTGKLAFEGDFRLPGSLSKASTEISGTIENLTRVAPWNLVLGNSIPFSGAVSWRKEAGIEIIGLDIETQTATLRGGGEFDIGKERLNARFDLSASDISKLSPISGTPIAGSADLSAHLKGSLNDLMIDSTVVFDNLAVAGQNIGRPNLSVKGKWQPRQSSVAVRLGGSVLERPLRGNAEVTLRSGLVDVKNLSIDLDNNKIDGALTVKGAKPEIVGRVTLRLPDLAQLPNLLGPRIYGSIEGEITAGQNFSDQIQASVTGSQIGIENEKGKRITIDRLSGTLRLDEPTLNARMASDIEATDITAMGRSLRKIDIGLVGSPNDFAWKISGAASEPTPIILSAAGTLVTLSQDRTIGLTSFAGDIGNVKINMTAPTKLSIIGRRVVIDPLKLAIDEGRIRLAGSLDEKTVAFTTSLTDVALDTLQLFDPRLAIRGTVSGQADINGPLIRPAIKVNLAANNVSPAMPRPSDLPALGGNLNFKQDADGIAADLSLTGVSGVAAYVKIQSPRQLNLSSLSQSLNSTSPIRGQASGAVDLSSLAGIFPSVSSHFAGTAKGSLAISGTFVEPQFTGGVEINKGEFESNVTGIVVRDLEARATIDNQEARLSSLTANDGRGGTITATGGLRLDGIDDGSDLAITFSKFSALHRPDADLTMSGELGISGEFSAPVVTGDLTVDGAELRIPDRLPETVTVLEVTEINGALSQSPSTKEQLAEPSADTPSIALKLKLTLPGKVFVRGRGLDSEWKGKFEVSGETTAPVVSGNLEIVRGTLEFAGRTFTLRSGTVRFLPDGDLTPDIDAIAEANISDILARVRVVGRADRPRIEVTSEPALPQEEVLSRILFGNATGQLTPLQAAQLARTAATLSGGLGGGDVVDKIRQALGLNVLTVESQGETTKGASLKAGKYITDKVFLSVSQGAEPGTQKLGIEVEVLPQITVESGVSGATDNNIGVNWRYNY